MNLPKDFPQLKELREKMDARSEPDIDMKMRLVGVTVTKNDFEIDDEIPIVQSRKVVLYIREPRNFQIFGNLPKYHILHCSTLKDMQKKGDYHKYYATRRMDGMFPVKLSDKDPLELCKLTLCFNCLKRLKENYNWNVFPADPEKFPLEDWFEPFFDYSSRDWQKRSLTCRERANWTCQQCSINLKDDRHFLHAHHKYGTRFDDPDDLMALCISCHAEQPKDGHRLLKYYPEYDRFIRKYGNRSQHRIRFNLPNQEPHGTQELSTRPCRVTEDDIPF